MPNATTQFPAVVQLSALNGQNGFRLEGEASGDASGYSVSIAGDVNGDGLVDLLIGAYEHDTYTGLSYVVFGSSKIGDGGFLALSSLNGTNGFKIISEALNSQTGYSVSTAGDLNRDGYADILIGAISYNGWDGRAYTIFGAAELGNNGLVELAKLNGTNGFKIAAEAGVECVGTSVSHLGDMNGDNYTDLLIGAYGYNAQTGRSYVLFGGPELINNTILGLASLDGKNGFRLDGERSSDRSGWSVSAAGDVNNDGYFDLLIGAPQHNNYAGCSYVVFGGAAVGESGLLELSNLNGTDGFKLEGEFINDLSGWSVSSAGDVNGDSYGDLLIGNYHQDNDDGRSYVIFGGSMITNGANSLALSSLNGTNGFKIDGGVSTKNTGWSVSEAGDMNSDGYADLFIGAPYTDNAKGQSFVVFGSSTIGSSGLLTLSNLDGKNGFRIDGESNGDLSSWSISAAGDVNVDGYDDLLIGAPNRNGVAGCSYVIFGDQLPLPSLNIVTIHQNQSLIFTEENLNVTNDDSHPWGSLSYVVSAIQNGRFTLVNVSGQSIYQFNQEQVLAGQIQFIHDNSLFSPSYTVQITGKTFAISSAQDPIVTFYRKPVLVTRSFDLHQGESILMTTSLLNVTDDYPPSQVIFTINDLKFGEFQLLPMNSSIFSFTEQQLSSGEVIFVQNGSDVAPSYQISVSDPYFTLPAVPADLIFYRQPVWINNQLSVSQGESEILTTEYLAVIDDYPSDQVLFTVTNIQQGRFQLLPFNNSVTEFTEQAIWDERVVFVHDSGPIAPSYQIEMSDPYFMLSPQNVSITFTPLPPFLIYNQLPTWQGKSTRLTMQNLQGGDPDINFNLSSLIFNVSQVRHGYFYLVQNPLQPISEFNQAQIMEDQVEFIQDGTASMPSYDVILSDGRLSTPPQAANVSFSFAPSWIENQLSLYQGQQVILNSAFLSVTDDYPDDQVRFTVTNLQYGQFQLLPLNGSVTQFTQQEVFDEQVMFIHDSGPTAPSYNISMSDPYFTLSTQATKITFTSLPPVLLSNQLAVLQGQSTVLTLEDLAGSDPDLNFNLSDLTFIVNRLQHGKFNLVSDSKQSINQFTQAQIEDSQVEFTHDGTTFIPSYEIVLSDGRLSTVPQGANISFEAIPIFVNNRLSISPGQVVIFDATNIRATDDHTPYSSLIFTPGNVYHGHFSSVFNSDVAITAFAQQQISDAEIEFIADDSGQAPAYQLTVTDDFGLSTTQNAQITFTLPPSNISENSDTVRNAIIGAVVSGVVGLLFFGFKLCLLRRAEKYFEQATLQVEEGSTAKKQADFHQNVIRPLTKKILGRIKLTGLLGYISKETTDDAISAIVILVNELEKQGVNLDLTQWTASGQSRLLDTIARQTRRILVPEAGYCSVTGLSRFFCPETTPRQLEEKAFVIAQAVKEALSRDYSLASMVSESDRLKGSVELKSFTPPLSERDPSREDKMEDNLLSISQQQTSSDAEEKPKVSNSPAIFGSGQGKPALAVALTGVGVGATVGALDLRL